MLKEIKLYPKLVSMSLRSTMSYKADSLIQMVSFLVVNAISLATVYLILDTIPQFGDWSFARIAFLFGFILIPKALDHMFFDDLWMLAWRAIRKGELDVYLTRPMNPLYQFVCKTFKWDGAGDLITGCVLIAIFAPQSNIVWSASTVIGLIFCAVLGIFVFTGIKLLFASLSFWLKTIGPILTNIYGFCDYAKYPIRELGKAFTAIMFYVIPFGLFLYYPIECLITGTNIWISVGFSALATVILLGLAYGVWSIGLKHYDSSGN